MACFRTTLGLFGLSLHLFYLIVRDSTCTFLASDIEFLMAVVNNVHSVSIAIDGSFLEARNSLLIIIIFVSCYSYYLQELALLALLLPIWG